MTHRSVANFSASFRQARFLWIAFLGLAPLGLIGCSQSEPSSNGEGSSGETTAQPETPATAPESLETADDVLQAVVDAYQKAASYDDKGSVSISFTLGEDRVEDSAPFSVALVRPDKLRACIYLATVIVDGQYLRAFHLDLPNQVIGRELEGPLTLSSVYCDPILAGAMTEGGMAGASPTLLLLLHKDPLKVLLKDATAELLEPGQIGDRDCFRVEIKRDAGSGVFWIDREKLVLRRIEYPTGPLKTQIEAGSGKEVKDMRLVAEFSDAALNVEVDDKAFQFEMPESAEIVSFFEPPNPGQLAGEKVPEIALVDLEGKPVGSRQFAGKTVVLSFFDTVSPASQRALIRLEEVYQKYKDNENITMLAVSVDPPQVTGEMIAATLADWEVHLPVARDTELQLPRVFMVNQTPALFVLDSDGVLQHFEVADNINLADDLPPKLDKVLAGEDIYHPLRKAYHDYLKQYEEMALSTGVEQAADDGGGVVEEHRLPQTEIAPQSSPTSLRLTPLWKYQDLNSPGNVLVVPQSSGEPKILVVDDFKSVVELNANGTKAATHDLQLAEQEAVANLRTVVGADGKRYYAVFANLQQRTHLFDENWNLLCHFPEDALENPHTGIGDVQLADLDGDGTPEACVGYWGVVGVQGVSLEGKRIWSNRSISSVLRVAAGAPGPDGKRNLYCINSEGSLAVLDSAGQMQGRIALLGRLLNSIESADLYGDGQRQWCGLAAPRLGENLAIGLNLKGEELWNYELPPGVRGQLVEPIIPGNVRAQGPGQWLLPGADGSVHILSPDGQLVDKFNHGAAISGLATAKINGQPALLISSAKGLEAFSVE